MGLFNFNVPKPRPFRYRPMYYDERKERLEKMKARAEAELTAEKKAAGYTGALHKGFLAERRANSRIYGKKLERGSTLRFLIILIALLGALYLIAPEIFMAVFWSKK